MQTCSTCGKEIGKHDLIISSFNGKTDYYCSKCYFDRIRGKLAQSKEDKNGNGRAERL